MAYFKNNLPWPFNNREMYIQACGILLKERNQCILAMSSVEGDSWLGNKFSRNSDNVTTQVHKSFMCVEPISSTQCRLKMIINADPHLDYIP
jgi:hypothetical protein